MKSEQRIVELKKTLDGFRKQGLVSFIDIVLNHTAHNSEWIKDHPDAAYNTDDCPHLWSAWELDYALQQFSKKFELKKVPECPCAPYIANETDLGQVMKYVQENILDKLKIHEFFHADVATVIKTVLTPGLQNIDEKKIEVYKAQF